MMHRATHAATWLLGLVLAGFLLRLAATGDLASPPVGSLDELAAWSEARDPAAAALGLVRLVAELAVWYLLAVSVLHAASTMLRASGGHRAVDAIATPAVRRLVRGGLGLGLAAASTVGGQDEARAPGSVTMRPVAEAPLAVQTRTDDLPGTATMRPRIAQLTGVAQMTPVVAPSTWTVARGESLWTIAEDLLADAWQRPPADAETDPFWRTLVERNRSRLVDPADPGLIHPGQVFDVPRPPEA